MDLAVLIKIGWIAKTWNLFVLCFCSHGLATIIKAIYTSVSYLKLYYETENNLYIIHLVMK